MENLLRAKNHDEAKNNKNGYTLQFDFVLQTSTDTKQGACFYKKSSFLRLTRQFMPKN